MPDMIDTIIRIAEFGLIALVAVYFLFIRRVILNWGANADETAARLPGDDIVASPERRFTRVVTVGATPERVWPWIVQMGFHRAGWYNYDWVNRLMGAAEFVDGHRSARRIVPELQALHVGDTISIGGPMSFTVGLVEPNRALVLYGKDDENTISWALVLEPSAEGTETRLISRWRYSGKMMRTMFAMIEPGAFAQERAMMLGVKARAEGRVAEAGR